MTDVRVESDSLGQVEVPAPSLGAQTIPGRGYSFVAPVTEETVEAR